VFDQMCHRHNRINPNCHQATALDPDSVLDFPSSITVLYLYMIFSFLCRRGDILEHDFTLQWRWDLRSSAVRRGDVLMSQNFYELTMHKAGSIEGRHTAKGNVTAKSNVTSTHHGWLSPALILASE
jgi:hypothetical protein